MYISAINLKIIILDLKIALWQHFLKQNSYMRNPDMFYVFKMEYYVSKINVFGLKMMVKNGLEKIFFKFLHSQSLFQIDSFNS
jgi:hypothetical protein